MVYEINLIVTLGDIMLDITGKVSGTKGTETSSLHPLEHIVFSYAHYFFQVTCRSTSEASPPVVGSLRRDSKESMELNSQGFSEWP